MTKKKLKQYGALKREIELIDTKLDQLYDRQKNIPTVLGKVRGSSPEFPYIEVHTTVQMDEPGEADSVKKLISIKKARKKQVSAVMIEIEQFIAGIPDSTDRQIFELTYLEKKKQREVAEIVGLEQSSISKKITSYLKLSYNS